MNNIVLDTIILFVKAIKNDKIVFNGNKEYIIQSPKYLLNQIIRQYKIPQNHYLISKKAKQEWEKISTQDICNYFYRQNVKSECDKPINLKIYKNNSKSFVEKTINKGEVFVYKDIFHNEHIVPINVIIKELCTLEENNLLDYKNVEAVLDKIYVCRMLKEEDRAIQFKSNRSNDYKEVIKTVYNPVGIEVENYK